MDIIGIPSCPWGTSIGPRELERIRICLGEQGGHERSPLLDVARAAGQGRTFLQAVAKGGEAEAEALVHDLLEHLEAIVLQTGSATLEDLRRAPRTLGPDLAAGVDPIAHAGGAR